MLIHSLSSLAVQAFFPFPLSVLGYKVFRLSAKGPLLFPLSSHPIRSLLSGPLG